MSKTLSVSAIENGTVIDHVPSGQSCRILQLLRLHDNNHKITVGLNLPSKRLKLKDLIKIENHTLAAENANQITIFAPGSTINIIKECEVVEKLKTTLPSSISNVFICPNPACITNAEPVETHFMVAEQGKQINLICKFCEKIFDQNLAAVRI